MDTDLSKAMIFQNKKLGKRKKFITRFEMHHMTMVLPHNQLHRLQHNDHSTGRHASNYTAGSHNCIKFGNHMSLLGCFADKIFKCSPVLLRDRTLPYQRLNRLIGIEAALALPFMVVIGNLHMNRDCIAGNLP